MPGTLIVGTLDDGAQSKPVGELMKSRVMARVSFNGQGIPLPIYESDNVSSITDLGVGYYQVNFTKPMPSLYYTTVATAQRPGTYSDIPLSLKSGNTITQTVNQVPLVAYDVGGAVVDPILVTAAVIV